MSEPSGTGADEPPVQVPDDARDLALEAEALRRERASQRRRARLDRLLGPRSRPRRIVLLLLLAALGLVGVGALLGLLRPAPDAPGAAPLADPPVAAGREGGLLPEVVLPQVDAPGGSSGTAGGAGGSAEGGVPVRALRPAVVVLVPEGCGCPDRIAAVAETARAFVVRLVLVGPDAAELRAFGDASGAGAVWLLRDADTALARAVGARGLTGLVVAPDGVVTGVERDLDGGAVLVPALQRALARG